MKQSRGEINVPIAIASLAISLLLFVIVLPSWMSKQQTPFYLELTVEKRTFDDQNLIIDKQPAMITVHAQVSDKEYDEFKAVARAEANLTGAKPGTFRYPVSLYPPAFQRIVEEQNLEAEFTIEKRITQPVRVSVTSSGKLSDPTQIVDSMTPATDTVYIEGPASDVKKVAAARATLRLGDLTGTGTQQVLVSLEPVDNNDRVVDNVEVHPAQVMVTPQFSLAPQQKQAFVNAVIGLGQVAPGYEVKSYSVDPPHVTISGPSQSLARVGRVSTEMIDVTGLTQTQTFTVKLKSVAADVAIKPNTVQVTIVVGQLSLKGLHPRSSSIVSPPIAKPAGPGGGR